MGFESLQLVPNGHAPGIDLYEIIQPLGKTVEIHINLAIWSLAVGIL